MRVPTRSSSERALIGALLVVACVGCKQQLPGQDAPTRATLIRLETLVLEAIGGIDRSEDGGSVRRGQLSTQLKLEQTGAALARGIPSPDPANSGDAFSCLLQAPRAHLRIEARQVGCFGVSTEDRVQLDLEAGNAVASGTMHNSRGEHRDLGTVKHGAAETAALIQELAASIDRPDGKSRCRSTSQLESVVIWDCNPERDRAAQSLSFESSECLDGVSADDRASRIYRLADKLLTRP